MYIIARTVSKRPTLQHILHDDSVTYTLCGLSACMWSRVYMEEEIAIMLCRRCQKVSASQ